jgi:hypothetical protein
MRTKLRSKIWLLFMTFAVLLAIPAVALADNTVADGDGAVAFNDSNMAMGSVCSGVESSKTAPVKITRQGSATGTNTFANSATVTVTASVTGAGLSAEMASPNTITLPSNWGSVDNGALSESVSSTVKVNSSVAGDGSGTVTYSATGKNADGATITRSDTMQVSWTTANCDTTAPVITPVVTGTLGNNGWYTSDVSVSWTVVDNESAISSKSASCDATTTINTDTAGQTVSCTATSAGGTDTKSVTIKRDATAPVVSLGSVSGTAGNNGWYTSDVTQTFNASDALSGIVGPASFTKTSSGEGLNVTVSSGDVFDNAGNKASNSASFNIDKTPPTINHSLSPAANGAGWNNTDVLVDYTCSDATSGVASCGPDETLSEGANQSSTGNATDNAGNTASDTVSDINIDKTDPNVALVGGPANGQSYYFGSVPPKPTCTASDALSGLAGPCQVSGYGTTVGSHTVKASATDNADNNAEASSTYTVLAWTFNGFYQPVDMGGVFNTVKGGSTVPLKFELFAGSNELTDTSDITSLTATKVNCDSSAPTDAIEITATGSTSLRYDSTGGQFIYNWKTPTGAACYKVTLTAQDGSTLIAYFKSLK